MGFGVCRDRKLIHVPLVTGVHGSTRDGVYNLGSATDARFTPKHICRLIFAYEHHLSG